jgi:hypothetical protein
MSEFKCFLAGLVTGIGVAYAWNNRERIAENVNRTRRAFDAGIAAYLNLNDCYRAQRHAGDGREPSDPAFV